MQKVINIVIYSLVIVNVFFISIFSQRVFYDYYYNIPNLQNLSNVGQFLAGTIGVLTSLLVGLLLFATFMAQKKQSFENTYFQLLQSYENIVNKMDISAEYNNSNVELFKGRKAFKQMYEELKNIYITSANSSNILDDITATEAEFQNIIMLEVINSAYLKFDYKFQPYIGYYFRTIYYIVKIVDSNIYLSKKEKRFYAHLLRAHLSTYELLLFFYSSLSERGRTKSKPLIEKYNLLKHITIVQNKLIDKDNVDHMYLYASTAYKR